jgi:hypothetical protein
MKRLSDKLDYKKLRLFIVIKKILDSNYELRLPKTIKIYPIFYISLLEPAPSYAKPKEMIEVELLEGEYEVETILSLQKQGKTT